MKVLFLIALVVFLICAVAGKYRPPEVLMLAATKIPGFVRFIHTNNETRLVGGSDYITLKYFIEKYNLRMKLLQPLCNVFGHKNPNGSWTGIISKLYRKEADIGVPSMCVTYDRYKDVEFTIPISYAPIAFIVRAPGREQIWDAIFLPFNIKVWCFIIASLIVNGIIIYTVLKIEFNFRGLLQIPCSINDIYWFLFGSLLQKGENTVSVKANTLAVRYPLVIWWMMSLVLASSYAGAITSFMTCPLLATVPRTYSQLAEAIQTGKYTCGTMANSSISSFFSDATTGVGRTIGDHMDSNPFKYDMFQSINMVLDKKFAYITGQNIIENVQKVYGAERLLMSEDSIVTFSIAFALKKNFLYKSQFNQMLSRLFESGIYKKLEATAFGSTSSLQKDQEKETVHPLTVEDILSPILLLGFGYILSIICLIVEISIGKKRTNSI